MEYLRLQGVLIQLWVFGLPRIILKKGNVIPYGPFLSLAAFVSLLFRDSSIKTIDHYLNIYLSIFQLL